MADFLVKEDSDKILQEIGDGIILEQSITEVIATFTGDANLERADISDTFTVDASLLRTLSDTFTGDSSFVITRSDTFTGDANLVSEVSDSYTGDANLKIVVANTFTSDANLKRVVANTFTSDTIITPKYKIYSNNSIASINIDDTNLAYLFTSNDYSNVLQNDSDYVGQAMDSTNYSVMQFKEKKLSQQSFNATWTGQSSLAPASSTISLQVFNKTSQLWETLDSDTTTAADIDFTLEGEQLTNLNDYYDVDNWLSFRVYQQNS